MISKSKPLNSSRINRLEEEACKILGLNKSYQHFRLSNEGLTGVIVLAKESENFAGERLDDLSKHIKRFYEKEGFFVKEELNKNEYDPLENSFVKIPRTYYDSKVFSASKDSERYSIIISKGDDYTINIMKEFKINDNKQKKEGDLLGNLGFIR